MPDQRQHADRAGGGRGDALGMGRAYGNPSSTHWAGRPAREWVETARAQVAALLGCAAEEIVFTSGGSEANNLALKGVFFSARRPRPHFITTGVEHPAITAPLRFLGGWGAAVTRLPVDGTGRIDPEDLRRVFVTDEWRACVERKAHWEDVYRTKAPEEVSWYQPHCERSLDLVRDFAPDHRAAIIDVGGGASTLVDDLVSGGFRHLTVLDLSGAALAEARQRLGRRAAGVHWMEADALDVRLPQASVDLWHDRAVFHFLTSTDDQQRYVGQVGNAVKSGGHVVVATFAEDGPTKCSGLTVQRYSPESLRAVFGTGFQLVHSSRETHLTPAGKEQAFIYCVFRVQ